MEKKYSFFGNLHFLFANAWKTERSVIFYTVAHIPIIVLVPLVSSYLTKNIVAMLSAKAALIDVILQTGVMTLALALLNVLNMAFSRKTKVKGTAIRFNYIVENAIKTMDTDYENIEGPEAQDRLQKCENAVGYSNSSMTQQIFRIITAMVSNILGLVLYSALIFSLSSWIVMLLAILSVLNYSISKHRWLWWKQARNKWGSAERQCKYLRERACGVEAAKDIRLYQLMRWFEPAYVKLMNTMNFWRMQEANKDFQVARAEALLNAVRDGVAYGVLLTKAAHGKLAADEFVFYFSLIAQYSTWMTGIFKALNELGRTQIQINDLRSFWDMPDTSNRGPGMVIPAGAPDIVFEHVTFRYRGAEKDVLKDVSFRIRPGEKVALVGRNGSGKTTIVKLLCNLYQPVSGEIRINGKRLEAYNRDELWKIYSVVFQDVHVMPLTIAENIALVPAAAIDREKLWRVLAQADLETKIQTLPDKENTLLVKQIHSMAASLSGGELQKLALARALYKGGSIVVLDEPTAALDPITESHQYERYAQLTGGCSSLYISHRLASTQFCDRVLYIEDGTIQEEGSHQELVALGGKYAELYAIQSHYYRDEVKEA